STAPRRPRASRSRITAGSDEGEGAAAPSPWMRLGRGPLVTAAGVGRLRRRWGQERSDARGGYGGRGHVPQALGTGPALRAPAFPSARGALAAAAGVAIGGNLCRGKCQAEAEANGFASASGHQLAQFAFI